MYKMKYYLYPKIIENVFHNIKIPMIKEIIAAFKPTMWEQYFNSTKTVSFRGPLTYTVPEHIKNLKSLTEFKWKIKQWKPLGAHVDFVKFLSKI